MEQVHAAVIANRMVVPASPHRPIQKFTFTWNRSTGLSLKIALVALPKSKSPTGSNPVRCCVHTKYTVDPGRYSHRSTALPRSDRVVKSGSAKENAGAGPAPSGSTVYVADDPDPPDAGVRTIVPMSSP